MRLLVCGGRNFDDAEALGMALHAVRALRGPITALIHGDCRNRKGERTGADKHARQWAIDNGIPEIPFPADWKRYGDPAGPIRNQQMIDEGRPDRVIAFPGGRGTADMCERARAAKVPVWCVNMKTREIETLAAD